MHRVAGSPAAIGPNPVGVTIGHELDVAVQVRAIHANAGSGGERSQRLGRGVTVLVALARRDDRNARPGRVKQGGRRR